MALQDEDPLACNWEEVFVGASTKTALYIMTCCGCKPRSTIAAFDMDGTIITTKSGRVFATHVEDWKILYEPQVSETLAFLYHEGYKIVVITNQAGISTGKVKIQDLKQKVEGIVRKAGVPLQLFCSTSK